MLNYGKYKELFKGSTATEDEFTSLVLTFNIQVLSIISDVYNFEDLYTTDKNLELIAYSQINFTELAGEFSDGIQSQSATNSSVTYSSDKKEGEYNWNKSVKDYIQKKYGMGVIRVETCI